MRQVQNSKKRLGHSLLKQPFVAERNAPRGRPSTHEKQNTRGHTVLATNRCISVVRRSASAHRPPTKVAKACSERQEMGERHRFQTGSPCMPMRRTRVPVRAARLPPRPRSPSSMEPLMLSNPRHF